MPPTPGGDDRPHRHPFAPVCPLRPTSPLVKAGARGVSRTRVVPCVPRLAKGQECPRCLLDAVDLEIERGEFVFMVGASGSGKSTFLHLVLREERPTAGRIYVAGRDLSTLSTWKVPHLRRQIGVVFQDFRLLPTKTVFENVAFALQVIGKPRHHILTTVPATLELVGLAGTVVRMWCRGLP